MPLPPWSSSPLIVWDEFNLDHIARHGVTPWEVEEVLTVSGYEARPHKKRNKMAKYRNRYLVTGQTIGGRNLLVVVDLIDRDHVRPATAFGR
jgi:hypothetical protein